MLTVAGKQTQSTTDGVPASSSFRSTLDIFDRRAAPVRVRGDRGSSRSRSRAPRARPSSSSIRETLRIVGEVRLKVPNDMLREQLSKAPTARGRWLAAQALARSGRPARPPRRSRERSPTRRSSGGPAPSAPWRSPRSAREALRCSEAREGDGAPEGPAGGGRRARQFPHAEAVEALKPHALRDDSYLVEAEAARALGKHAAERGVRDCWSTSSSARAGSTSCAPGRSTGSRPCATIGRCRTSARASATAPAACATSGHHRAAEARERPQDARDRSRSSSTTPTRCCASTSCARSAKSATSRRAVAARPARDRARCARPPQDPRGAARPRRAEARGRATARRARQAASRAR
jgi:hypothetical protein